MALTQDESLYPIVIFSFAAEITPNDWDEYVRACYLYLERNDGVVLIHDHSWGGSPNPSQRAQAVDMVRDPRAKRSFRGSAVVTQSSIVRGAATALLWLVKQPIPMRMFATSQEAIVWAKSLTGVQHVKQA